METTKYIYEINFREDSARVVVGVFDPERWDGKGGTKFGFEAEVYVDWNWNYGGDLTQKNFIANVSQAAIGNHSPAEAKQRISCYTQAAEIASFINDRLLAETPLEMIGNFLKKALPTKSEDATPVPFQYGA